MKVKVSYSPTLSEINEVDLTIDTVTRGEWTVGRSPTSDLVLDSPDVSRQHAKFFVKGGTYYFSDLGSRNGSIVNGKQAEKERPYLLNDGDVIRIADYVLIMEAIAPMTEQLPETVFRIIDPSLFSRQRSPENISNPNVASPPPQVVNEVSTPISEVSAVASTQTDDDIPVVEATTPENIVQPPEAISEIPHDVRNDIVDLRTLVVEEEHTVNLDNVEFAEVSEVASHETQDVIETPEEEITPRETTDDEVTDLEAALAAEATFVQQRREIESAVPQATEERDAELEAALEAEVTFVQPRDITADDILQITEERDAELEAALEAEVTFVQPRDIFNRVPQENVVPGVIEEETPEQPVNLETPITTTDTADVEEVTSNVTPETPEIHQQAEIEHQDTSSQAIEETKEEPVNLDTPIHPVDFADADEVRVDETVNQVPEDVDIQHQDTSSQVIEETNEELVTLDTAIYPVDSVDADEVRVDKTVSEVPNDLTAPDDNVSEVFSNQYIDLSDRSPEAINVNEVSTFEEIPSFEPVENEAPEIITPTVAEVSEPQATESQEIAEQIDVTEPEKAIAQRNIVLIAHESKKSELGEFVAEHQEFFSQSHTITWPSVSEVLHQQAGITVSQQTPAPTSGGFQTIASLVGSGEILAVIFLRDLLQPQPGQANEEALLRLCTINQVLLATNVPTAEAIVHYLKEVVN
jgi:methylglyoxal synthase